jgi:hypothetical protein
LDSITLFAQKISRLFSPLSFFFFQEAFYAHSFMVLVGINHISLDGHEKFGGLMCVHNILSSGKK